MRRGDAEGLRFGEFVIDPKRRGLFRSGERVHLTPKAFETLAYLAERPGSVVSKEELLAAVWGGARDGSTVEHMVRQIRWALDDDKDEPRFIKTIPWQGYSGSGHNRAIFYSNVLHAVLTPSLATERSARLI